MENIQFFLKLCRIQLGKVRLQTSGFTLFPILFEVKPKRQKKQLYSNISLAPCEKSSESKVILQKAKSSFRLDGAAKSEINSFFRTLFLRFTVVHNSNRMPAKLRTHDSQQGSTTCLMFIIL